MARQVYDSTTGSLRSLASSTKYLGEGNILDLWNDDLFNEIRRSLRPTGITEKNAYLWNKVFGWGGPTKGPSSTSNLGLVSSKYSYLNSNEARDREYQKLLSSGMHPVEANNLVRARQIEAFMYALKKGKATGISDFFGSDNTLFNKKSLYPEYTGKISKKSYDRHIAAMRERNFLSKYGKRNPWTGRYIIDKSRAYLARREEEKIRALEALFDQILNKRYLF